MGILDSLKDSFVLSKINKKSNIEIEQLVNLTDNKLINKLLAQIK